MTDLFIWLSVMLPLAAFLLWARHVEQRDKRSGLFVISYNPLCDCPFCAGLMP